MRTQPKNKPFPHLVRPALKWNVQNTGTSGIGFVRFDGKDTATMGVPFGDQHEDVIVRNHELAHGRYSSDRKLRKLLRDGLHPLAVNAAEDFRIGLMADRRGVLTHLHPVSRCTSCRASFDQAVQGGIKMLTELGSGDPENGARALMAVACGQLDQCPSNARGHVRRIARKGARCLEPLARYLHDLLLLPPPEDSERPAPGSKADKTDNSGPASRVRWAPHQLVTPPLQGFCKSPFRKRATDSGVSLHDASRLTVDRRVFQERCKSKGVSLLIDVSGSMALSPDAVAEVVQKFPASVVGMYGAHSSRGGGSTVVIARNGRMVTPAVMASSYPGGANLVDGPALEWLSTQPAPRIWVSDGQVTEQNSGGHGEVCSGRAVSAAAAICRRGAIVRCPDVDTALRYASRKRPA